MKTFINLLLRLGAGPYRAQIGSIGLGLFIFVLSGCVASPNLVFVHLRGVKAQGGIAGQREQIEQLEISVPCLAEDQARDLWVDLTATRRVMLAEITENRIKDSATSKFSSSSQEPATITYYHQGYAFEFTGGGLTSFKASRYGFPPAHGMAFVRLGSRKSGNVLSLPCSLETFEKVFGKADQVGRGLGW